MTNIKKERLEEICKELIVYLDEYIDDDEELYETLENAIGLTTNEIDQLSGNFDDDREGFDDEDEEEDDRSELPWDYGKHFED